MRLVCYSTTLIWWVSVNGLVAPCVDRNLSSEAAQWGSSSDADSWPLLTELFNTTGIQSSTQALPSARDDVLTFEQNIEKAIGILRASLPEALRGDFHLYSIQGTPAHPQDPTTTFTELLIKFVLFGPRRAVLLSIRASAEWGEWEEPRGSKDPGPPDPKVYEIFDFFELEPLTVAGAISLLKTEYPPGYHQLEIMRPPPGKQEGSYQIFYNFYVYDPPITYFAVGVDDKEIRPMKGSTTCGGTGASAS